MLACLEVVRLRECSDGGLQQTHQSFPICCPLADFSNPRRSRLFCLVLVSVFSSLSVQPQAILSLNFPFADGDRGLSACGSCLGFRSSGTCGVWTWTRRWHLSTPCRRGPWRSHSAGRSPGRESLSSSAWCTPLPAAALVCRFWSRSDGRSSSPPSSRTSVSKGHPRDLREENKKYR